MSHLLSFWGKTDGTGAKAFAKPVIHHLLDVAAVAFVLMREQPTFARRIAAQLQIAPDRMAPFCAFLAGLHDLGKISVPFQAKSPPHWPQDVLGPLPQSIFDRSHWRYSALLLRHETIRPDLTRLLPSMDQLIRLIATIAGHHGAPPSKEILTETDPGLLGAELPQACIDAAAAAFAVLERQTGMRPMPELSATRFDRIDVLLNGIITFCDWVGSDTAFFPMPDQLDDGYDNYWQTALQSAGRALGAKGQSGVRPLANPDYARLGLPCADSPRPMQAAAAGLTITEGPQLIIIEDATGSGKTETALLLAARLMAAGKAEGLYFALPTMATANAMHARMQHLAHRMFEGEPASLILAHAKAGLARRLASLQTAPDRDSVDAFCNAWIVDSRRLALFADIGVGTIDQAFLAVLRKRHLSLRQAALSRRVLVVDEAHSFDAYMDNELKILLSAHARNGGSAIILSATLPQQTRQGLVDAFHSNIPPPPSGLKGPGGRLPVRASLPQSDAQVYPLLTHIAATGSASHAIAFDTRLRRTVTIERLPDRAAAHDMAVAAAARGAAVAIICNAVDEAIAMHARLAAALPHPGHAHLFHARFTVGDRMAIERDVLARFGKGAAPTARSGHILVGTQVIEQSLDIDFDLMISDLAPIDLLIQRAGRLWRHMNERPASERPLQQPVLAVISPDPDETKSAQWLEPVLGKAAFIYRNAGVMWRSARTLFAASALRTPEDMRPFIEAVYSDADDDLPRCLQAAESKADGEAKGHGQLAEFNAINLEFGYLGLGDNLSSEEDIGTRLGENTRTIRLARRVAGRIEPFHREPGADLALDWALSEITLRQSLFTQVEDYLASGPDIDAVRSHWPEFERQMPILLPEEAAGSSGGALTYSNRQGLSVVIPPTRE